MNKLNYEQLITNLKEMGMETSSMGALREGRMHGYRRMEGDKIELKIWNQEYWRLEWVGGIGVVISTLDTIGSDKKFIQKEYDTIENVIKKLTP